MPIKLWQMIVRFWYFLSYLITTAAKGKLPEEVWLNIKFFIKQKIEVKFVVSSTIEQTLL